MEENISLQPIEILGVAIGDVEEIHDQEFGFHGYAAHSLFDPDHESIWTCFSAAKNQLILIAYRKDAFQKAIAA